MGQQQSGGTAGSPAAGVVHVGGGAVGRGAGAAPTTTTSRTRSARGRQQPATAATVPATTAAVAAAPSAPAASTTAAAAAAAAAAASTAPVAVAAAASSTSNSTTARQARKETKLVKESVFDVISTGDLQQIQVLLSAIRDFDINALGPNGNAPLHHAVNGTLNTVEVIRLLVRGKGASLNRLNADGETALIIATCADREDVVRALLELGADVDCPARSGGVPLYYALTKRCRAVLPSLLARRPNVNFLTEDGESILHAAVRFGDAAFVDAVLHGLRVYPGGKVLLPPLANGQDEELLKKQRLDLQLRRQQQKASNDNNNDQNDAGQDDGDSGAGGGMSLSSLAAPEEYHRWTHTVSLLDARSTASWDAPIGMAVHTALNPSQSGPVRVKATEVAQLLSVVRQEMLCEDHLDLPRTGAGAGTSDFFR